MEKFTKGPWHADKDLKAIYNTQCNYICDYPLNNDYDKYLIAAAPDMYEFIKSLLKFDMLNCVDTAEAEALLVKARGEL